MGFIPKQKDDETKAYPPLTDPEFRKGGLSPMTIEERRKWEVMFARFHQPHSEITAQFEGFTLPQGGEAGDFLTTDGKDHYFWSAGACHWKASGANIYFATGNIAVGDVPNDVNTIYAKGNILVQSDLAQPYIKISNASATERDPVLQFAVGATPVVKWTYGLRDSDSDNLLWCNTDGLVDTTTGDAAWDTVLGVTHTTGDHYQTNLAADALTFGYSYGTTGSGDTNFSGPRGICSDGTYYYICDYANHRIKKHRISDGLFMWAVGTQGSGDDQFNYPIGICTDGTWLYITDLNNDRIKKHLCSTGAYVAKIGSHGAALEQFLTPTGICTDGTWLYITEGAPGSAPLLKKHLCSTLAGVSQISADGHLDSTNCRYVCTDGTFLYLPNSNNSATAAIFKYTLDLVYVSEYGTDGAGDAQFSGPQGIATDGTHLYISDNLNSRIKKHRVSDYGYVSQVAAGCDGICIGSTPDTGTLAGRLLRLRKDGTYFDVYTKLDLYRDLVFREDSVGATNYVAFKAPAAIAASYTLTLPGATAGAKKHLFSGATDILDWGQNVDSDGAPSFDHLHLTIADGTAPLVITSTTEVANLNAHLLQGHHAADFAHADAKYIVQELSGDLSAEQSLGALATGILKNTTTAGVGVLSIASGADLPDHSVLSATHGDSTAASVVLGDIVAGQGASPNTKWVRLAGNTTTAKQYLSQTGTGAVSAAPAWAAIAQADVTGLTTADNAPFAKLTLTATETLHANNATYSQLSMTYTVAPDASAATSYYCGQSKIVAVDAGNAQPISTVNGYDLSLRPWGTGAIAGCDGLVAVIDNRGSATASMKGMWGSIQNYKAVSGFAYGLQNDISSWANDVGTGNIATCRAQRLRIQNQTLTTATGAANIDAAQIVYGNILNDWQAGGTPAYGSTIGAAAGFEYDLTNGANCVITNSYGVKLNTPSNSGTITNHYGIYLADQSGIGGTANWAVYSAGGAWYIAGALTLGTDLAVAEGGTGASTFTDHGVLYGQAANAIGATAEGATGQYLAGTTGAAPSWATLNQAAVAGLTTADGPTFAHLHLADVAAVTTAAESWVGPSSTAGVYFKGGFVSIGTATPAGVVDFQVSQSWSPHVIFDIDGTANPSIKLYRTTGAGSFFPWAISNSPDSDGCLSFRTGTAATIGAETLATKAIILPSGNVGINDTAPAEKLDVTGGINTTTHYHVADVQVVGNRQAAIAEPAETTAANTLSIKYMLDTLAAHGLVTAQEKMLNGGFDSDTTSWTSGGCTVASVAGGQSGNCLEVTYVSGYPQVGQTVAAMVVGLSYDFSVYVKSGSAGTQPFKISIMRVSDYGDRHDVTGTSSGTWVQYSHVFTTTESSYYIFLYWTDSIAGTMLWDTASLKVTQ